MNPVQDQSSVGVTLVPELERIRLDMLESSERFRELDRYEAYFRCRQYESRRYDWSGRMRGYGDEADIKPGWYVPLRARKPATQLNLAKIIVRRFTAMTFGGDLFPQIVVDGDEDAQDFLRVLKSEALLPSKMQEARDLGGAVGAVGASFAIVDGKPRVSIHNAKHVTVLRWADRHELRPAAVLEAYSYPLRVWEQNGKPRDVRMYFAHYWDEEREILWDPIPEAVARTNWAASPNRKEVAHGLGFCPFYWTQNLPDGQDDVGESDYDGQLDDLDEINILKSSSTRGAIANMDPTLVIREDPAKNPGTLHKGTGNAIWASGGAQYLELQGTSVEVAMSLGKDLSRHVEETCGVVLADPQTIAGKAQSAAALRMMYLPMLNQCGVYRTQYGDRLLVPLLLGMLRAARIISGRAVGPVQETEDGRRLQPVGAMVLPDRVEKIEGSGEMRRIPRKPGTSEAITLNWPPFFPNTWTDIGLAVTALQAASGGKPVVSQRTAVENAAVLFGVADVSQELDAIEDDADKSAARAMDVLVAQPTSGTEDTSGAFDGAQGSEPKE